MPRRREGEAGAVMDELAVPLVRSDGSGVDLTVTLGASTRVFCDPGDDPLTLVIDLGHSRVMVEAVSVDPALLLVTRQFAEAAEYLHSTLVAAGTAEVRAEGGHTCGALADRTGADARRGVLDEAHTVLRLHVAGEHGLCSGCLDQGRLAPVPCPPARRAVSVVETHGVAVWDVPSGRARSG